MKKETMEKMAQEIVEKENCTIQEARTIIRVIFLSLNDYLAKREA